MRPMSSEMRFPNASSIASQALARNCTRVQALVLQATERFVSAGYGTRGSGIICFMPLAPTPTPNPSFKRTCRRQAA